MWKIALFKIYWDEEDVKSVTEAIRGGMNWENGVIIEDYVQIGSHCSIYSVSTIDNKEGQVILKRNSRIGSHSLLMPGVTIGENSIIGAFSFVNADVPDNVVAVGVPAKVIRKLRREEINEIALY